MPVIDGVFVPRTPLAPAELHVDWAATNTHVVTRRERVELAALPAARRVATLTATLHGHSAPAAVMALRMVLERQLDQTAQFGYASVTRELSLLRGDGRGHVARAAYSVPDAGRYASFAAKGLTGVLQLVGRRAAEAAAAVARAAAEAVAPAVIAGQSPLDIAVLAARRTLHNQVLELVGETLNLGRAAAAVTHAQIPEFAMRSEQLDRNTCAPCDELHGTIVQVDTPDFFAILPPTGCLGGGRCRGLMVFGDGPRDVRVPELLAA